MAELLLELFSEEIPARMQRRAAAGGASLRPHIKTHKSLRVAALQVAAGAVGLVWLASAELDH